MNDRSVFLTKFEVAERQLNQAIRLFFEEGDSVSIHTLAEAASQILYDLRSKTGATSFLRDSDWIREDHKKEWLAILSKSRNFFKHADRDADQTHEFNEAFNHFSLIDAVSMYMHSKHAWTPETALFMGWLSVVHPNLVKENSDLAIISKRFREGPNPVQLDQPEHLARCLKLFRSGAVTIPGISLKLGLPEGS